MKKTEHNTVTPLLIACGVHMQRLEKLHGLSPMTKKEYEHYSKVEAGHDSAFEQLHKQGNNMVKGGSIWDAITSGLSSAAKFVAPIVADAVIPGSSNVISQVANRIGLGDTIEGGEYKVGGDYPIGGKYDVGGEYAIGGKGVRGRKKKAIAVQEESTDMIDPAYDVVYDSNYQQYKIGHLYKVNGTLYEMTATGFTPTTAPVIKAKRATIKQTGGSYIDDEGNYQRPAKKGLLGATAPAEQRPMTIADLVQ